MYVSSHNITVFLSSIKTKTQSTHHLIIITHRHSTHSISHYFLLFQFTSLQLLFSTLNSILKMKNLSMSSSVSPQQRYEGGGVSTHDSEERRTLTSKVLAIITGLHAGVILLALAGLSLLGALTVLVVTTPLFILFSPVLVPAIIVTGLTVVGFFTSVIFGLTALSLFSWVMNYIRHAQGTLQEHFELEKQRMVEWWSEWCNMKVFFSSITMAAILSLSSLVPQNHCFNITKTTRRFLTNSELTNLQHLKSFLYSQNTKSGSILVRVMRDNEVDPIVCLLADAFAELMLFPKCYINVVRFLMKQYLIKRRTLMPHVATLIGFYRGLTDGEEMQLAGTVEICFDKNGVNSSRASPTPPKDSPYIYSLAVDKSLRR